MELECARSSSEIAEDALELERQVVCEVAERLRELEGSRESSDERLQGLEESISILAQRNEQL